jgi:hypothetical protein
MKIITPTKIEHVVWEGVLEPPGEAKRGAESARVTIGEPAAWSVEEAMEFETGKTWTTPEGDKRYKLVRLVFTLHPPEDSRTRYTEATLTAYLHPRNGSGTVIAHDLYPQRISATGNKSKFSVGLGADLKFTEAIQVGLPKAGYEIEFQKAFPVVQGFGLGESNPYWQFSHHSANPLIGCLSVYIVLAVSGKTNKVEIGIELIATQETKFGFIRLGLPEEARAYILRTIKI